MKLTIRCACMEVYIVEPEKVLLPLYCKCGMMIYPAGNNVTIKKPMPTPAFEKIEENASVTEKSSITEPGPSVHGILQAREGTHGDFTENSALSRRLRTAIFEKLSDRGYKRNELPAYFEESVIFICHKLARMACGNPAHDDHWADIAGYATLTAEQLRKEGVSIRRQKVPKRSASNLSSEE